MAFTIGKPVFSSTDKYHMISIRDGPPIEACTNDPSILVFTDEANSSKLDLFVKPFLAMASPYFSKPLDPAIFSSRIVHAFDTGQFIMPTTSNTSYNVSWIPIHVIFAPSVYTIQWRLISMEAVEEKYPGLPTAVQEVPDRGRDEDRLRARQIRAKIRKAKLRCALAKLQVEKMAERYYNKYGNFDGLSDSDSELSSESESETTGTSKKI